MSFIIKCGDGKSYIKLFFTKFSLETNLLNVKQIVLYLLKFFFNDEKLKDLKLIKVKLVLEKTLIPSLKTIASKLVENTKAFE